jgi:hypothetical protein
MTVITNRDLVRQFVEVIVGSHHLPELYCTAKKIEDVPFNELPDSFVVKTIRGGFGGNKVDLVDKATTDIQSLKTKYDRAPASSFGLPASIIVEELLPAAPGCESVIDYKFVCFRGKAKFVRVSANLGHGVGSKTKNVSLYSLPGFELLPVQYDGKPPFEIAPPAELPQMIDIAQRIAVFFPTIRVDMYLIGDRILIGELTPFDSGAWAKFEPKEWDAQLGRMMTPPFTQAELDHYVECDRHLIHRMIALGCFNFGITPFVPRHAPESRHS